MLIPSLWSAREHRQMAVRVNTGRWQCERVADKPTGREEEEANKMGNGPLGKEEKNSQKKEFDGIIRHFTNGVLSDKQWSVADRCLDDPVTFCLATALRGIFVLFSRSRLFLFFSIW